MRPRRAAYIRPFSIATHRRDHLKRVQDKRIAARCRVARMPGDGVGHDVMEAKRVVLCALEERAVFTLDRIAHTGQLMCPTSGDLEA